MRFPKYLFLFGCSAGLCLSLLYSSLGLDSRLQETFLLSRCRCLIGGRSNLTLNHCRAHFRRASGYDKFTSPGVLIPVRKLGGCVPQWTKGKALNLFGRVEDGNEYPSMYVVSGDRLRGYCELLE